MRQPPPDHSLQEQKESTTTEEYLRSKGVKELGKISQEVPRHYQEKTRHRLVTWSLGIFGCTVLLSGGLTGIMAFTGPERDYQPIKDWTHMMLTAQIGIMGAACGYYFGSTQSKHED